MKMNKFHPFRCAIAIAAASLAIAGTGCNKVKSLAGQGDDGGSSGGGVLSNLLHLDGFEGEIGVRASGEIGRSGNNAPVDFTLDVKKDKVRAAIPPGIGPGAGLSGYGIVRSDEKKLYYVDDTKKQAIVVDLNKAGEHLAKASQNINAMRGHTDSTPPPPPKVTKTGKTDTVAGHKCENWDIEEAEKHQKMEICVADEGASWFHIPFTNPPANMAWAGELMDGKHFPLRAITYDSSGAERSRVEVTRIDKKSLEDSLFEVPAGYTQVDLEQLFAAPGLGMPGGAPPGVMVPPHGRKHHP